MTARKHEERDDTSPQHAEAPQTNPVRKPFIEPTISSPVDVLEATTMMQILESGATN